MGNAHLPAVPLNHRTVLSNIIDLYVVREVEYIALGLGQLGRVLDSQSGDDLCRHPH